MGVPGPCWLSATWMSRARDLSPGRLEGAAAQPPPTRGAARDPRVDPNPLNPLQFRSCPASMPYRDKNNYRNQSQRNLTMYAVLVTGGKQHRVMQGETLRVEKLEGDVGSELKFDNILMLGDADGIKLGDDIKGASIAAKIVSHGRADKIRIVKFRRRKHHRKQMGHRQNYTEIQITGIAGDKNSNSTGIAG